MSAIPSGGGLPGLRGAERAGDRPLSGPDRPRDLFAALRDGRVEGEHARLRAAAQLLEGQFYQNLFSAMRDTVPEGGLTSGGAGEEMFTSLLDQRMADAAAARQETGLSRALYRVFAARLGPEGGAE